MRARKLKNLDERFEMYASALEEDPYAWRASWQSWQPSTRNALRGPVSPAKRWNEVCLDLGSGKGESTVRNALNRPDILFIGIDNIESCVALSAQKAVETGAANVVFVCADAFDILDIFAPGELSCIYLSFPSPFPKKKHAEKRLTHFEHLSRYRSLLADGGSIRFTTDSVPLFEFSLIQFEIAGYEVHWLTRDLAEEHPERILTGYEKRLIAKGAKIHALEAAPGEEPAEMVQRAPLSLVEYLPEDLSTLEYVPYGMEDTVFNMSNRQANARRREERERGAR
ncbi:MAG: methyltransferase domain-containing protein [Coriobacteriales bacterium]|nr:methyltransferase domain-containing protein [Coriobacteriales bacterium]